MRKQDIKRRDRQRGNAVKQRKSSQRRKIKALVRDNVRTSIQQVGLESWLQEIMTLVRLSFESGEVSRFGGYFSVDVRGQRMAGIMNDEGKIPKSWLSWAHGFPSRVKGQRLARYAH